MTRVLVTGTTGMLGAEVVRTLGSDARFEVYGLGRRTTPVLPASRQVIADLADPQSIQLPDWQPDFIIHTAALTDLGLCERDPQLAERVHVESSKVLAALVKTSGCFFYVSTDSVFDGDKGGYTETSTPNPLNVYAATKLRGEVAVQNTANKSIILRTNIYGAHHPRGKSLAEWALAELTAGKKINGFPDIFFNAVYTGQLAEVIRDLMMGNVSFPVLNIASSETISKYEFLRRIAVALRVNESLVEARPSSDFPSALKRPTNTSLDTKLLSGFHAVPTFTDGIGRWVASL